MRVMESAIKSAIEQAQSPDPNNPQNMSGDPALAALAILEKKENLAMLHLFDGYDETGASDGFTDPNMSQRANELRTLGERLRAAKLQQNLSAATASYAQYTQQFIQAGNPNAVLMTAAQFLTSYDARYKAAPSVTQVTALVGDDTFRTQLLDALAGMPPDRELYKDAIVTVLAKNPGTGQPLKDAVLAALAALETQIADTMQVELGEVEWSATRDRDLQVENSVAALVNAYSTRATDAQTNFLPQITAIADATDINTARTQANAAITAQLSGAQYANYRRELATMIASAPDTVTLKANVTAYINAQSNPAAADTTRLNDELYTRELSEAVALIGALPEYDADYFPAELREFALVYGYTQAKARYAEFLAAKNSDAQEIRDGASLNLSGLGTQFAEWILVKDVNSYAAANTVTAYRTAEGENASLEQYWTKYQTDRKTNAQALPLAEFRTYILIATIQEYMSTRPLTGGDATARKAEFRTHFESLLDDAAYTRGGKTLRERLSTVETLRDYLSTRFSLSKPTRGPSGHCRMYWRTNARRGY